MNLTCDRPGCGNTFEARTRKDYQAKYCCDHCRAIVKRDAVREAAHVVRYLEENAPESLAKIKRQMGKK